MLGIYRVAAQLVASRAVLSSRPDMYTLPQRHRHGCPTAGYRQVILYLEGSVVSQLGSYMFAVSLFSTKCRHNCQVAVATACLTCAPPDCTPSKSTPWHWCQPPHNLTRLTLYHLPWKSNTSSLGQTIDHKTWSNLIHQKRSSRAFHPRNGHTRPWAWCYPTFYLQGIKTLSGDSPCMSTFWIVASDKLPPVTEVRMDSNII
jgi:hypothetical protein